jgi:PqqD family protein of HPr-rel-A system
MTGDTDDNAVSERPQASADLEVNEAPDGLVIYDTQTGQVHYLNPSASAVFALCTGDRDAAAIAREMQSVFGLPEPPSAEVAECLEDLSQRRLVL